MQAKTMEGLAGASMNIKMVHVPMRVYKEAERRGDTATMERAMGYASEFTGRAVEYKEKAQEGLKEEAEVRKETEKLQREKAMEESKEERKELEEIIKENQAVKVDVVEISQEGKTLLEENTGLVMADTGSTDVDRNKEARVYTKTGGVSQIEQKKNISICI